MFCHEGSVLKSVKRADNFLRRQDDNFLFSYGQEDYSLSVKRTEERKKKCQEGIVLQTVKRAVNFSLMPRWQYLLSYGQEDHSDGPDDHSVSVKRTE